MRMFWQCLSPNPRMYPTEKESGRMELIFFELLEECYKSPNKYNVRITCFLHPRSQDVHCQKCGRRVTKFEVFRSLEFVNQMSYDSLNNKSKSFVQRTISL